MPKCNGAEGNYGVIERKLLLNSWIPEERCVFIALLVSFDNPYRIGTVAPFELAGLVHALQIADCQSIANPLPISRILEILKKLEIRGSIKLFEGNRTWIVDGWSYTGSKGNPKREEGARTFINAYYPEVWRSFAQHYGLPMHCQPIGKVLAMPKSKSKSKDINTVENPASPKPEPKKSEAITKRNLELQPLAERLAEIVSKAESTAGITRRAENSTEKIIDTVRALVDIDKYRPSEIELCARWAFLYSGDEKFNLQNLANIGNWRKQWKGGRAFTVTFKKWEVAGRPESQAAAQSRDSRQGGRGSVAGTESLDLGR